MHILQFLTELNNFIIKKENTNIFEICQKPVKKYNFYTQTLTLKSENKSNVTFNH